MATLDLIKDIPLFAGLDARELEEFLRIFEPLYAGLSSCLRDEG